MEDYGTTRFKFSANFDTAFVSHARHYSRLVKITEPWMLRQFQTIIITTYPIPGRSLAWIASSNPAGDTNVTCMFSGSGLCVRQIICPE